MESTEIENSQAMPDISYLYFGNLFPGEPQYKSGTFHGLALREKFDKDIAHDARKPMPFGDGSINGFQSQDVFEHIEYENVSAIFDEIFRCLKVGGLFRLSLPDYNSPLLIGRSVYDSTGKILCDLAMGGAVTCKLNDKIKVTFGGGGESHLWFPTYSNVTRLILASELRKCTSIKFHHAFFDAHEFICEPFDQNIMPVSRVPPKDMRAGGKPISIVVDFVK